MVHPPRRRPGAERDEIGSAPPRSRPVLWAPRYPARSRGPVAVALRFTGAAPRGSARALRGRSGGDDVAPRRRAGSRNTAVRSWRRRGELRGARPLVHLRRRGRLRHRRHGAPVERLHPGCHRGGVLRRERGEEFLLEGTPSRNRTPRWDAFSSTSAYQPSGNTARTNVGPGGSRRTRGAEPLHQVWYSVKALDSTRRCLTRSNG